MTTYTIGYSSNIIRCANCGALIYIKDKCTSCKKPIKIDK